MSTGMPLPLRLKETTLLRPVHKILNFYFEITIFRLPNFVSRKLVNHSKETHIPGSFGSLFISQPDQELNA
jgi:hypothetical protein